jgi:exopolysaccharide biosynthesis polyprenyl glycosylphosphotransferase
MWWQAPWLTERKALLGLALFDALVITGAYNALFWYQFNRWAGITGSVATLIAIWLTLSYLLGRYSRTENKKRLTSIVVVAFTVCIVTMGATWVGLAKDPRALPQFTLPLLAITTALSALAERSVQRHIRQSSIWLLIASSEEAKILLDEIAQKSSLSRFKLLLCHDSDAAIQRLNQPRQLDGIVIGEQLNLSDELIQELLQQRNSGQTVLQLMDWCESTLQRIPPELLSSRWLLVSDGFHLRPGQAGWRLKRLGDLATATALFATCLPVMALAALLIKLDDGGPVFYSQIRTGLYGDPFRIWKLRSMQTRSERDGAQWASQDDPRITRIGHWLRRLRLDELPQLINVIKGDMSLIGPRPERPELEASLEQSIPHYRVRHWIRPGLSGWSQVSFPYGASTIDSRIKLSFDLYYLRNFSLALDLLILLKTIRLVARAEGAIPRAIRKAP